MTNKIKSDEELIKDYGCEIDELGHAWGMGWEDSDTPHPGFGTMGGYVTQCYKCGAFIYESNGQLCSGEEQPVRRLGRNA